MPLIQRKGAQSSQGFGEFSSVGVNPNAYIENLFSTWLYTGTGANQTITNNINLSGNGGLVWIKDRTNAYNHNLFDTAQGATKYLHSNTTAATGTDSVSLTSFNANGFSLGTGNTAGSQVNTSADNFASWTFRKQAKFFDIVTYTGTGANRTIAHNLNSTPGCIIVKRTDTTGNWQVYHSGLTSAAYSIQLNLTNAQASAPTVWNSTAPTSSVFSVGTDATVNASGGTYVAYLFASNAGGFGSDGTQNVITCGSFTTDGSGNATVNLGYEPQWVLYKRTTGTDNWVLVDNMRPWGGGSSSNVVANRLYPNSSSAEVADNWGYPTATGFQTNTIGASSTFIYIAIRRGPMKTPTSGTSVFYPDNYTSSPTGDWRSVPFTPSVTFSVGDLTNPNDIFIDALRGNSGTSQEYLITYSTSAAGLTSGKPNPTLRSNSLYYGDGGPSNRLIQSFLRAPGFFDEVCYTGTGANTTQTHNLGVVPELMIVKERSLTNDWQVYSATLANTQYLVLNASNAVATGTTRWNSTTPTSSVFSIGTDSTVNASTQTYVAYLFASCPGVSKVGTYSGTGATQTINCGFTGGARYVLIKRTDSTGDWYMWDTARGMVAGTDPYLLLDQSAAQVNANNVYTTTGGFQIVGTGAGINASGGTYLYLAIA